MEAQCPFCNLPAGRVWFDSKHSCAFLDGFPITGGHTLVIPKRHVQSVFELPEHELEEIWSVQSNIERRFSRTSYETFQTHGNACSSILDRSEEHTSELQSLRHLVCR